MTIAEDLSKTLQIEARLSRKMLERVPEDKLDYKPHPKSMTLGQLANHLAEIPQWTEVTVAEDHFDFDESKYQPKTLTSPAEMAQACEEGTRKAIETLQGRSDEHMTAPWRMTMGGNLLFEKPRIEVVRDMMVHHTIHHRAQLGVYLRLLDVPVPAIYGPSADEQG
jgi:uncharacterized damage-inducible protein DinB